MRHLNFNKQKGMTILETLLVFAIAATFVITGMRMYMTFKNDNDVMQLRGIVDTLFVGMASYYQEICFGRYDNSLNFTPGILNPQYSPSALWPVSPSTLISKQYLPNNNIPPNSLVDTTDPSGGYVLRYNRDAVPPSRYADLSSGGSTPVGNIIVWRIQVAVKLKPGLDANAYLKLSGADCLSSSYSISGVSYVYPCSSNKTGSYLVWERLPSYASPQGSSILRILNPSLKQFQQMYTTYPMTYLLYSKPSTGTTPTGAAQNYLCGT